MRWLVFLLACSSAPPDKPRPPRPIEVAALPDVAEPEAPADGCAYDRIVTCAGSLSCEVTRPATNEGAVDKRRRLSVAETNAARAEHPDACCYVEFIQSACDGQVATTLMPSPDPPEPEQPRADCAFSRYVRCVDDEVGSCSLLHAPFTSGSLVVDNPHYSASETRTKRQTDPRACCYVEFVTTACD